MKAVTLEATRHIVIQSEPGDVLPAALARALDAHEVRRGFVRASGVLADVELRAHPSDAGASPIARKIAGPLSAVVIDGSVGVETDGLSLRGVFARETDRGLETLAGEIVRAKVMVLDALVIAVGEGNGGGGVTTIATAAAPTAAPPVTSWTQVAQASVEAERKVVEERKAVVYQAPAPVQPSVGLAPAVIPQRPVAKRVEVEELVVLDAGDIVEHFAFGTCDVVKSDGDRLQVVLRKDGRMKEIAVEVLKVTQLPEENGKRHFKLERRV